MAGGSGSAGSFVFSEHLARRDYLHGRSPLRAWLQHFDRNGDDRISWREFCDGLKELNYEGDIVKLWNEIDEDGSGEITLEEIDQESNEVWLSFRRWCAMTFQNGRDMLQMLTGGMLGKVYRR